MARLIISEKFIAALAEAGIIDDIDRVHRVIIDCKAGAPVNVLVEKFGDDRLLELVRDGEYVFLTEEQMETREEAAR